MTLVWMVPVTGLAAVLFACGWQRRASRDTGTAAMQEIAGMIFEGAMAFLSRQYKTIGVLAIVTAVAVALIVGSMSEGVKPIQFQDGQVSFANATAIGRWEEGLLDRHRVPRRRLLLGARRLHRHVHRRPLERPDGRRRAEEPEGRDHGRRLRGGAVSGFLVVALSLLGVSGIFLVYSRILDNPPEIAPFLIVGFGFGASFVALFAQLGGGIYTKAADVGADLVGKVEAGIPEDDPRNAAVVADLVGDNVGDCAGRGADLFESMSAENIGAMILGVAIFTVTGTSSGSCSRSCCDRSASSPTIVGLTAVPFFTDGIRTASRTR